MQLHSFIAVGEFNGSRSNMLEENALICTCDFKLKLVSVFVTV